MMKKVAFYVEDTGNPDNSADHQLQQLRAQTAGEEARVAREYVDQRIALRPNL